MATVKITPALISQVKHNANALFAKRIDEAATYTPDITGDELYEMWADSEVGLREDLVVAARRKWVPLCNQIKVGLLGSVEVNREFAFTTAKHMPAQGYYEKRNFIGPRAEEMGQIHLQWQENLLAVSEERDTFIEGVEKVLTSHATLKQALVSWPGLWQLVPQDVKDRHNQQTAPRTKADKPAPAGFDLDALNAAVVTAKIIEGGVL